MREYQLKTRQICLFFIAFLPLIKFFMLPSVIAEAAKEDMWISTLINLIVDLVTLFAIINVCKKTDEDFYTIIKEKFGEGVAKTVYALYAIYFILKGILPICEQKDFIQHTLYMTLPNLVNFLPFFIIAFYLSVKHIRVLGRTADVMWIVTVIGVIFMIGLSLKNVDYGAFLPVGANGIKSVLKASYRSACWYGDAVYLLFFTGKFKLGKKDGRKIILSYISAGVGVLCFMLTFYGTFTSIAFRQKFALTEISKYSTVINNIGRVDYLGIFLIMSSNVISLSLPIYFACYTLNKILPVKNNRLIPLAITLLMLAIIVILREYFNTIEELFIYKLNPVFFIFGNVIPLILPVLIKKEKPIEQT